MDLENFLSTVPLFSSIPGSQLREIANCFQVVRYKKDQTIFNQGDQSNAMYIIRSGAVSIKGQSPEAGTFEVELLRGDFFGEMALISDLPRNAGAQVALDAVLYRLKQQDFKVLLDNNKEIGLFLSRLYARRLSAPPGSAPAPMGAHFYTVSATHPQLGLSHFLYSMSFHIATESEKQVLVVEPLLEYEAIMEKYELYTMPCPDESMYSLLPPHLYTPQEIRWFQHPSGFQVLQIDKGFKENLGQVLTLLMEKLKLTYDLVFFNLGHRFGQLEQQAIRLCHKNMVIIRNTSDALPQVRQRLQAIEALSSSGLDRVRVGVSHLIGSIGIPREALRNRLHLSETPQIWIEKSTKAKADQIDTAKCFPIRGARAIAREIANVRVGIALGAGAARGYAHIGVLKVLQEEGIHIDMIAGTSIGALVGAVYAAQGSVRQLFTETVENLSSRFMVRKKIYDYTLPFQGLLRGRKVMNIVGNAIAHADFMDLKIPTYLVGVDILRGEEILFETGDVTQAVRSSLSLPGIFVPHRYRNRWMVDGGLLNPVPVNILEQKGADKIIAVCVENPHASGPKPHVRPSILTVIMQTVNIVHSHATRGFAQKSDLVIYPNTREFAWDDFHRGSTIVRRGERACREMLDEIKAII